MAANETPDRREDEARLRDLAGRYARMMDRMSFDDLPRVFAADGAELLLIGAQIPKPYNDLHT